jgi:glycerol-3-phosphate acyltransferase PlsY
MTHLLTIVASYLLGSVPTGLLLARLKGIDIRKAGSGNIGFSNVMRVAGTDRKGRVLGLLTLIGDMGKGILAVKLAARFGAPFDPVLSGLFVFLGHLYPVWLRGKGGKGVATGLGVALGINLLLGLIACLPWALLFLLTKTPSIASLGTFAILPVLSIFMVNRSWIGPHTLPPHTPPLFLIMGILVFLRHRENIKRLISGNENSI